MDGLFYTELVWFWMNFRIQMTVSVSRNEREGVQSQKLFPLYVFLARLVPDVVAPEVCIFFSL